MLAIIANTRSGTKEQPMCGRFTLRAPASLVAEQFGLFEMPLWMPRFNIAPTQPVPVIRLRPEHSPPQREFATLRWGLVPGWAKDPSVGNRMINARADTVAEKPAYRAAFARRRCLVAADGFYEWQKSGRAKQPFLIHLRDDHPFAIAGLWESWEGPDQGHLETCTLLTTDANELMQPIHDRMPVILPAQAYGSWLDSAVRPVAVLPLLRPYPSAELIATPVSSYVNSPAHDDPQCIAPVAAG
jgi:putative SOS response-associated peptidase YedK